MVFISEAALAMTLSANLEVVTNLMLIYGGVYSVHLNEIMKITFLRSSADCLSCLQVNLEFGPVGI